MEKHQFLTEMGIVPWQLKDKIHTTGQNLPEGENHDDWSTLQNEAHACTACDLHCSRTQVVFGVGNIHADLMFIGEAPGFYEDQKGEPFVGRAGQLLNMMLQAIGLERSQIYIANILKCRPPENRDPLANEVKQCTPFLKKQIDLVKPKLLIALGRISAQFLLDSKTSLTQLRGKIHSYANTPLIVTYHPAYLLRNPADKRKAFVDLQKIIELANSP